VAILLQIALGTLLYGFGLWGAIKIIDRYNTTNSLALAMVIGAVLAVVMPVFGLVFVAMPLAGLLFVLVFAYDLGYGRGALVIALEALLLYIAGVILTDLIGDTSSTTNLILWLLVVLGTAATVWAVSRGAHQTAAAALEARGKRKLEEAERREEERRQERKRERELALARARGESEAPRPATPMKPELSPLPEPSDDPTGPRFLR
jgi:hypothetical protein